MKLIDGNNEEFIAGPEKMLLDELFELANQFGELETGGIWGKTAAKIKLSDTGEDYVVVHSRHKLTLKDNIAECMHKARKMKMVLS